MRIGERLKPSFWCSAWVGNLNTKVHSIDSWPSKRVSNSLLFCFGPPSPFSFPQSSSKYFWIEEMVLTDGSFFVWDFISGQNGRAQLVYISVSCFFFFSYFQCSWYVSGWWLFEPWLRILIMTSRSRQRVYWEIGLY